MKAKFIIHALVACAFFIAALPLVRAAELLTIAEQPFDAAAVEAERARLNEQLDAAVAAFDAQLTAQGDATRGDWHRYLKWSGWASSLLAGESADVPAMERVSWRLYSANAGFENPQIVALRNAQAAYLAFERAIAEGGDDLPGEHQRRLSRLRQALAAEPLDYAELEAAASWLAVLRQAPAALEAVRAQFSGPVIVLLVHRDLVEEKLNQFQNSSSEVRPTSQSVQGATVRGMATVESNTTARLLDGPGEVRLRVSTRGSVDAPHNVANAGRVRVASSASSQFTVTADVYWNGEKLTATRPRAAADTRSRIKHISAPLLVRRAAARRVNGSRASAEAAGSSRIEREAAAAMSDQLATAVEKLNKKSEGFLNFVTRTGNKAARWQTRVTGDSVQVGYAPPTFAAVGSLPHAMPPFAGEETLGLSIHDGGIEGILRALVAGKVWTDANFSQLQRELTGANSEELMIGLDPGRWSAQWDWRYPVRIHFTPEHATVRYRFARAEIDGAAYDAPFEVTATMQIVAHPLGFKMKLLAPAALASLDASHPLPPHFQSFLEKKFRGLFGEEFHLDGMQFPAGGALDGMSAFRVASVYMEPNWVHLRYTNRKPQATPVSRELAAPSR